MPDSQSPENRSLYEKVLVAANRATGRAGGAPRPPRPSAAVVLWRKAEKGTGTEVFWIRRARTMAFMGGWHAFPGGGLSRQDAEIEVQGQPCGLEPEHTSVPDMPESLTEGLGALPADLAPGILACALRELLEETGTLPLPELFEPAGSPERPSAAALALRLGEGRRRLLAAPKSFAGLVSELGLTLDASRLTFAGRWLTPPLGPRRFDNRFFLLEWPRELPVQPLAETGEIGPGEAEIGEWVEPERAIERWRRGEVITAPPILHILQVLADQGSDEEGAKPSESMLTRLLQPSEANLGPYRRIEFRPGVISLPLPTATLPPATHTNAYLLGRGERVLVDPGSGHEREIERLIATARASAAQGHPVREIWLTHHHPDHVGGLVPVARELGLPIRAHAATFERLPGLLGDPGLTLGEPFRDGEYMELAGSPATSVQVFHTPGHARGHVCFLEMEGRSLLAGDLVSAVSTIVVDPPEGDMDDYLASLERMVELGATTLFPGHGPPILDGRAKLEEFIRHRLWREEKILSAWQDGHLQPGAIRPLVYEEVPEPAWPLAERQIQAHLDRLRRAGRLS